MSVSTTATLAGKIEAFIEATGGARGADGPPEERFIRDALHGSVNLNPHEVAFVDTQLFQRLRGTIQNGGALYAYPSARHTRFEHALGVLFVADRMLRRLKSLSGAPTISYRDECTVRLAALLHDLGHGMFSHCSERVLLNTPSLACQLEPECDARQPHEQVGAALIRSRALRPLFEAADVDPAAVAALVLGDREAAGQLGIPGFLCELISGPIDADKLDYFARDAQFSGVAAILDLDRILQTIRIGSGGERLGLALAGATELEKLLFSRITMYQAIYNHHTKLAVENMIQGAVEEIVGSAIDPSYAGGPGVQVRAVRADEGRWGSEEIAFRSVLDFLRVSDEAFLAAITENRYLGELLEQIRRRELFKRAFVLTWQSVANRDSVGEDAYLALLAQLRRPETVSAVRRAIYEEARTRVPELRPTQVWVHAAGDPSVGSPDEYILERGGQPVERATIFSGWDAELAVPRHGVLRTYRLYKAPVYIFAPAAARTIVGQIACEVIAALYRGPGRLELTEPVD
jgi:HD superfamily phosphohydrolase